MKLIDVDGQTIVYDRYLPDGSPKAVVQIAHGRAEHAGRYAKVAAALTGAGYAVYVDDHRGHGRTGLANGDLGDLGPGGMDGVVNAVRDVTLAIPERPLFLLGHSWGSSIATRYLRLWADDLAGCLLTGTTGRPSGPRAPREFEGRTRYDWLTRDQAEVDRYIADPWCGFERVPGAPAAEPKPTARPLPEDKPVPEGLPILVFNGSDDPLGGAEGGAALADRYREAGVRDVTFKAYEGARHELFNELCREQVISEVIAWVRDRT